MTKDMKTILTRMFTVVVLMMISMAARADVKVLYGEKGTDKFEGKGGSIKIEQADSKDDKTKVTVYLTFIPQSGYTFDDSTLEVYAVTSPDGAFTRAPEISGDPLKLTEEKTDVPSAKRYSVDIDPALALWVKEAKFQKKEDASKGMRGGLPTISTDSSNPVYYLLQNSGTTSFYAMPYDNTEEGKVSTTNVPNDDMRFYFLNAGEDGGIRYYYIVHCSGRYLYAKGNANVNDGARLKTPPTTTSPNDDRYKFYITTCEDSNVGEGYYIINKQLGNTAPLCKRGGNTSIETNYFLKLNTYKPRDAFFLWDFVPISGANPLTWTVPFTLSTNVEKHYYKINNTVNGSSYISRNTTTDKVNTSSTASGEMYWYFKEVPVGANGSDKYITYYYIIHGQTGKYMCFDGDASLNNTNQDAALSIQEKTAANEENCQFIIPRASQKGATAYYNIIPKALKNYVWKNQCIGQKDAYDGTNVWTSTDRSGDTNPVRWTINEVQVQQAVTPVIQYDATRNAIIITTVSEGASFRYTTAADAASLVDPTPTTGTECNAGELLQDGVSNKYIKAIAVNGGYLPSEVSDLFEPVTLKCAKPVLRKTGDNTYTFSCAFPTSGVTIYYTTDGSEPTAGSSSCSGGDSRSFSVGTTIKFMAVAADYSNSDVATKNIIEGFTVGDGTAANPYEISTSDLFDVFVDHVNDDGQNGVYYKVTEDIDVSGSAEITTAFQGDLDGDYHILSGLDHAMCNSINGGTVKNVILGGVSISGITNLGAICNEAGGETKIYNCGVLSGSVGGGTNVGGLVGLINSGSSVRVVNCYNYANVSGSSYAAGIVGKNEVTVGNVRIAMCMMYGSVSGATNISPVYGGEHTDNVQKFTEYNFYLYSNERDAFGNRIEKIPYTAYNDQLAIDKDDYLTRFPFYRHILNTHRKLGAFFLFGGSGETVNDITADEISEIGHWALKNTANYPIVEKWPTNTKKVRNAVATNTVSDDHLPSSLSVKVKIGTEGMASGGTAIETTITLPVTAMDEDNFDYTYGKVVLPFANEFEGWTPNYEKICTGWKITGITDGTTGTFSNYNVSDRNCTAKDLYVNTGFIFAQGGNFIVPYDVTAIEITANFATAYYLSDATYEVGYDADYGNGQGLGGNVPSGDNAFHGQKVYTSLASALGAMSASVTPHAQAIVLVGNFHYRLGKNALDSYVSKGLTIMSIDEDCNQEPDYGWYSNNYADRPNMPPVRFDFLPMIPLGMAAHVTGSKGFPGVPIWKTRGWFEMTETCLCIMNQFELDSGNFTGSDTDIKNYRCIINGGYFTQMIRSNQKACSKVSYYQIGGNAYIKEFYPGNHSKTTHTNPLVPINVTGGEIEECFMTGYKSGGLVSGENIYFWCAGGKIHKFLGAYMDAPTAATVNLTAKIDHALIGRFFGGGTSPNANITGTIDVTIDNSKVDFYCGGPEFSSTTAKPSVTTTANGTTFGEYYGAGFGGTSITYYNDIDNGAMSISNNAVTPYPDYFNTYYLNATNGRLKLRDGYGIGTCYKFEFLYHSANQTLVARHFTGYAQFSLATTGNVINDLTNCKIKKQTASETMIGEATKGDFYGAGCQGMVDGTVTSTLTGCEVDGSAYGGGYQATSNDVEVYPITKPNPNSEFTKETGLFSEFGKVTPDVFTWEQGTDAHENIADEQGGKLYTSKDITMNDLGNVTGAISITIDGGLVKEDVFGGGNESKSLDDTSVTFKGDLTVNGDVFGGGNEGEVEGCTEVNIEE